MKAYKTISELGILKLAIVELYDRILLEKEAQETGVRLTTGRYIQYKRQYDELRNRIKEIEGK